VLLPGALDRGAGRAHPANAGGLTVGEIARAFLLPERTIGQRLVRAKRKFGSLLAETAGPREIRKTVTILFMDVAGSTELGERLDPRNPRDE
jgi:class 3 adenylate cyclase